MMRRRYPVFVLVCLLTLAATTGVATAAASPETPCEGSGANEVRLFLDTDEQITDDRTFYPGTTLTMYLCGEGGKQPYPSAWAFDVDNATGVSLVTERERSVVLTLEGSSEPVDLRSGIEKKEGVDLAIPPVTVQTGYRAESSITGDAVRFPSDTAADTFNDTEDEWERSIENVENASEALSTADSGSNSSAVQDALSTLNDSSLSQATTELQQNAIPAARSGDAEAVVTIVTESTDTAANTREAARESLRSYIDAVQERRSAAVRSVRLFVGGGLFGGILVGGVAGYALSRRTLSKIERDRGVSTATQYSPKQVALPLVLGVVALLIGIAVGALNWPTLFEVIL